MKTVGCFEMRYASVPINFGNVANIVTDVLGLFYDSVPPVGLEFLLKISFKKKKNSGISLLSLNVMYFHDPPSRFRR